MATPDPGSYVSSTIYLENKPSGNIKLSSSGYVSTDDIYYAWGPYRDHYVYTTSATPTVGSKLYEYKNGNMIWSANSIAAGNVAYTDSTSITNGNGYSYDRDTSKDILSILTLYTLTSTVEVGTHLYDAKGNDTGWTVGTVNQDGSFILAEEPTS